MSDYDRGAYTPPTDDPLAFDARVTRQRRPLPLTLIASAVVLLVMVGALVVFYQSGVRGANEPPRVVGETVAELKSAPVETARPIDEAAGLEVYVDDQPAAAAAPTFAPAPEQPRPRPAAPVEVATLPPAAAAPPAVRAPTPVAELPAATAVKAQPAPPAKAVPAPERVAAAPAAPVASGSSSVQIGAFSSAAIANSEYAKVQAAFARHTSGRGKRVEPVERDGQTLYRTAFTGFAKADAQAFCAALKAAGRACIVR